MVAPSAHVSDRPRPRARTFANRPDAPSTSHGPRNRTPEPKNATDGDTGERICRGVAQHPLPSLYRGSRCFIFPAVAEGFGLPVVEAMSCGVPVIAAAAGSLAEVVGAGGQLFEVGDQDALALIVSGLLMDDEREGWANAALGRAAAFSWGVTATVTERGSIRRPGFTHLHPV